MLPLFKKKHIHSRQIEKLLKTGYIEDYPEDANKRNALRQAALLYRLVDGEMFRYGTNREYEKYGLRLVVHDDQPEKKAEVIGKCHIDPQGGHYGMNNTIKYVAETYYWQGISAHVKMYCKQCEQCKMRSKFDAEQWLTLERNNIDKKKVKGMIVSEAQQELKSLGRVKKPTPPETFFIVNAERQVNYDKDQEDVSVMIDSNNIEYVVETLGQSDGLDLEEVCHVLNVPDIVPIPERFRSREIEEFLKSGAYPDDFTPNMKCGLRGPASQYKLIDDELYHEGNKVGTKGLRLVVHDDMPALKVKVMVECHIDEDGSHHGLNRTLNKIGEKYHWTGMSLDVRKFMLYCRICSQHRGRKVLQDSKVYEEEAQKVKERHMKKMSESEEGMAVSYSTAETVDQNGQVIQLIGSYEDITEITLPMVGQETVTTEGGGSSVKIMQQTGKPGEYKFVTTSSGSGPTYVIKEVSDAMAKIEAAEAAMELDGQVVTMETAPAENTETVTQVADEGLTNVKVETSEIITENSGTSEVNEDDPVIENDGSERLTNPQSVDPSDVVKVVIFNPQEKTSKSSTTQTIYHTLKTGEHSTKSLDNSTVDHAPRIQSAETYHEDIVYVPKIKKTRIIEEYLKTGTMSEGYFSRSTLKELSENFEMIDGVLYRRASRYKGRQIVVHDDNPELKYKIIENHHIKKNGAHCSELVTNQNVSFRFYWEQLKWDVHRWYLSCKLCVTDGVERKSQKKILNIDEQMQLMAEKRRNKYFTLKSRDPKIRKRRPMNSLDVKVVSEDMNLNNKSLTDIQEQLMNYSTNQEQKSGQLIEIIQNGNKKVDGAKIKAIVIRSADGDSEPVEIRIPENNEEEIYTEMERIDEELQELLIYATLDQEQLIKNMYAEKDWKYEVESLTPAEAESQTSETADLYMITLKVTKQQEEAIKELFEQIGYQTEVEQEVESQDNEDNTRDMIQVEEVITSLSRDNVVVEVGASDNIGNVKPEVNQEPDSDVQDTRQSRTPLKGTESKKRPLEDTDIPSTPTTETRRPRREIKRPRRFSPDNDVSKNTTINSSKKSTIKSEETISVEQSSSDMDGNTKTRNVSTVSTQGVKRINTNVHGESSPISTMVTKKDASTKPLMSSQKEIKNTLINQEKVSVMSKARITVKKVDQSKNDSDDDHDDDDDDMYDDDDDDGDSDDDFNPEMEELRSGGKESMEAIKIGDSYKCSLCDVKFLNEKACLEHGAHNNCYDSCSLCGKVYKKKDIESYMKHVNKHEKDDKLACNKCDKVFFDSDQLKIHERQHENALIGHCEICKTGFHTWFQFASHKVIKHGGCNLYTCDICNAKFVNISFMKSEVLFDGKLSYFKCVMCNGQS
ncbi:Gypsy retrotransposon integrase-like protein 1 [Mactra antiquata]